MLLARRFPPREAAATACQGVDGEDKRGNPGRGQALHPLQLTAGIIGAEMIAHGRSVEPAIYSPITFFTVSEAISVMIFTAMS
jgi:hypothetical protein